MKSLFISDLHLDIKRPEIITYFINFLLNLDKETKSLYILGDFVEYWVGDDDPAEGLKDVFNVIKEKSETVEIYLMHGNRDFMISSKFCSKYGIKLLPDPTLIRIGNNKIMLMHGDTLCIDDKEYQKFRTLVRSDAWQEEMLSKPLNERLALAKSLRARSLKETEDKDEFIMDVNQEEVLKVFKNNDIDILIHGHTHRPNIHKILHEDNEYRRIVLGDWYRKSFVLEIDGPQITIEKNIIY